MLLMSFERSISGTTRYKRDIMKILSRFDHFRGSTIPKGALSTHVDYAGLRLNMREFYRALIIGTNKTKRKKIATTQTSSSSTSTSTTISTQTKHESHDKMVQADDRDFMVTPDMLFPEIDAHETSEEDEQLADFMRSQDDELIQFIQSRELPENI